LSRPAQRFHQYVRRLVAEAAARVKEAWRPDLPVYLDRRSLPPGVDARLLRGGFLFADADLSAMTTVELVDSLRDWQWKPTF
jgi:hypothetical protein